MEMQGPPSPNPNTSYNNTTNNIANPISSQHASNNPSPATSTSPSIPVLFGNSDASNAAGSSLFKGVYHRRSHSDGNFRIAADDEVGLSGEPFNGSAVGSVDDDDLFSAFFDLQKFGRNEDDGGARDFMDQDGGGGGDVVESEKKFRFRHRYGSSLEGLGDANEVKKAIPPEKLAEIWAVDPKRVKRCNKILANRQSAARSKERKARYVLELERKVHALQSEATNLSAQLTIYQRDTTGLITENAELKIRLQAMEQQAHLRDALNEALKQEVERLKIATGEIKTPSDSHSLGAWRVPYSPVASPSTMQPVQYSPLPSPSTMQTVSYSSAASLSPSTMQTQTVSYCPVAASSPSTLKNMSYSPAASPSPSTTANLFPLPKKSVPVLAQLPPFHNSRSSLSSSRLHPANTHTPEQNESLSRLQVLDNANIGSNLVNMEGPPVSGSDSSSPTQLLTP